MSEALKTNTTLTVLRLHLGSEQQDHKETQQGRHKHQHQADNGLGDEGKEALREALQANTALTALLV